MINYIYKQKHIDMNFYDFMKKFETERDCIEYYKNIRYKGNKPTCNHCGGVQTYIRRNSNGKNYDCEGCKNTFSIFTGTIFEKSTTDLRKWFYAIRLFLNSKKGISGYQLQREIGVTYKCAWRMLKSIRQAMGNQGDVELFNDIYHHIGEKYTQLYIDEFCFRYNNRENEDMFDSLMKRTVLS